MLRSESLRSLIKERTFINSSTTTRDNVKYDSLLFTLKDYGKFVDNKNKIQMFFFIKYVFYFTREIKDIFNKNI